MFTCDPAERPAEPASPACACCRPLLRRAGERIAHDLSRRGFVAGAGGALSGLGLASAPRAQDRGAQPAIVLRNFLLFDGRASTLRPGLRLLIDGEHIRDVATGDPGTPQNARLIDCGGRVLMPGLIDAHWHTMFAGLPVAALLTADVGFIFLAAAAQAERTLMRGFTTIRDLGGPAFTLKQAIDQGLAVGPRIYPSGAMITPTGGHGDLRPVSDLPRGPGAPPTEFDRKGAAAIADSADEVRLRVREQLLQGASQIKLVGGGGVSSPRTTLDMLSFDEAELRAGVEAAADRGAYVTVHAYPPSAIRRALAAGARCIEHGHLMDDPTARAIADKGVWLSIQPFVSEEDAGRLTGQSRANLLQVLAGTNNAYALAKRHGLKIAFGTDLLFSPENAERQGRMLTHLSRWYGGAEILRMATSVNAELLAMSGGRNPYPGKLGVIEPGAYADLLVVSGDPLADVGLLAEPDRNLALIMKGGRIHKDALAA